MRVTIKVGGEVFLSSLHIEVDGYSTDRYYWFRDAKYRAFLKEHNFTHNMRVHELYLDLCAEGLL